MVNDKELIARSEFCLICHISETFLSMVFVVTLISGLESYRNNADVKALKWNLAYDTNLPNKQNK